MRPQHGRITDAIADFLSLSQCLSHLALSFIHSLFISRFHSLFLSFLQIGDDTRGLSLSPPPSPSLHLSGRVPLTYVAGLAKSRVSDISSPSYLDGQGMDENLAGHGMVERRQDGPQRFASRTAAHRVRQVGSTNVRPPPLASSLHHRLGTQAQWQCHRHGRSRQGNRLRLPRVGAHGIYDTNDPQSYISPVCRRLTASQVDEFKLWDRWRMVEGKKRWRT